MLTRWAFAFGLAAVVATGGTELLRRIALATSFVDRPGPTKSHSSEIPLLGGVAIVAATLAGWLLEPGLSTRVEAVALAGVGVALVGLVDDERGLGPWLRLASETAAAVAVVIAGIRAEPTGFTVVDIAITVLWVVGVTNALNLLDNMDGLAGGTAAAIAAGVFGLAVVQDQHMLATAAVAIFGACVGFLVHNWRPASIFMGDTGALFLGFVSAIAVIEVRPAITPPRSFVVPLLLLALPVLDTTVVSLARLRHGRRVMVAGKDHLSHRLVARGLSAGSAVGVLVAIEAALAMLAVLCGSAVLPLWRTGLAAVAILGALTAAATTARVYPDDPVGFKAVLSLRLGRARSEEHQVPALVTRNFTTSITHAPPPNRLEP